MINSYYDLKQFLDIVDQTLNNNKNYKKIRSEICLYALGKFNFDEAKSFYTNDYFLNIVENTNEKYFSTKLSSKKINEINEYFLVKIGANLKSLKIQKHIIGNNEIHLAKINIKRKEYYLNITWTKGVNRTLNKTNYVEKSDNLEKKFLNINLNKVNNFELLILVINLLNFSGYLRQRKNSYTKEFKNFFKENGYLVIDNFIEKSELAALKNNTYK